MLSNRLIPLAAALALAATGLAQEFHIKTEGPMPAGEVSGAVAGAVAGDHVYFRGSGTRLEGPTVKDAPYSAESVTETTQVLVDGNRIRHENRSKVYRDSEGRTRREESLGSLGPWSSERTQEIIFIHDPVGKASWVIMPDEQTARKMPMLHVAPKLAGEPAGENVTLRVIHDDGDESAPGDVDTERHIQIMSFKGAMATGKAPDSNVEDLGDREIEGVLAHGTRITTTLPAGAIGNDLPLVTTYERWYSADLQLDVLTERSDPRLGDTKFQLTNIQRTEPPTSLFAPPAGYKIVEQEEGSPAVADKMIWQMNKRIGTAHKP